MSGEKQRAMFERAVVALESIAKSQAELVKWPFANTPRVREPICNALHPDGVLVCTLEPDHGGHFHVGHSGDRHGPEINRWQADTERQQV